MIFWFLVQIAIMLLLSQLLQPKVEFPKTKPLGIDEFDIPTAEAGRSLPAVFGKRRYCGPNVVWYGHLQAWKIHKSVRVSWFNKKRQYLGWEYRLGMIMIIGHRCEGIHQTIVGEKVVWPVFNDWTQEAADGITQFTFSDDLYSCFGGIDKEGGLAGTVDLQYGESDQPANSYLVPHLGSNRPAYRGQTSVVLRDVYVGANAYIKPWSFLWKRTGLLLNGQLQWYNEKASIGDDGLNAIHCIRELLLDVEVGLGYAEADIDDVNFKACADVCYTENIGLHFNVDSSIKCEDLISKLLRIIDGALYQNQFTGQYQIHLAREDYAPESLEIFDESDIKKVESYKRPGFGEITSKVTVKWRSVVRNEVQLTTADDLALMLKQGDNVVESALDFQEIGSASLAQYIASRELNHHTSMLAYLKLKCLKTMAHINPNDVFKISWLEYGLISVIVRATNIDYGSPEDEYMTIECVEDIFGVAYNLYSSTDETLWTPPVSDPSDPTYKVIFELPYHIVNEQFGDSSLISSLSDDASFMSPCAVTPVSDALGFYVYVQESVAEDYEDYGIGTFCPSATIVDEIPIGAYSVVVTLANIVDLGRVEVDSYALLESELVLVENVDEANSQVTITRAILDTTPKLHSAGTRIWFLEHGLNFIDKEFLYGETPRVKYLTLTGEGVLEEASASYVQASFNRRLIRPLLPACIKINGNFFPSHFAGQPALTWNHRSRLNPLSTYPKFTTAINYGPEVGATYTLYIYDEDNVLVRTESGLTSAAYTYSEANERADCGLGPSDPLNSSLRFILKSVRDGYDSLQQFDYKIQRSSQGLVSATSTVTGDLTVI